MNGLPFIPSRNALLRTSRLTASLALGLVFGLLPATALASPSFPGILEASWDMSCAPKCSVCHTENPGSEGTASQPFGSLIVKNAGSGKLGDPISDQQFEEALALAAVRDVDVDEDGMTNFEELSGLDAVPTDPNITGTPQDNPTQVQVCVPQYGCGAARIAPRQPKSSLYWAISAAALLGLVAARRRARAVAR